MPISIRTASIRDAEQLAFLVSQMDYPTSGTQMENRLQPILSNSDYCVFVSQVGQFIDGFIGVVKNYSFELNEPYGTILILVVDSESRNKGIGKALIKRAESWFQSHSIKAFVVNSGKNNLDAHRFYQKLGYSSKGLRLVKSTYERTQRQYARR